MSTNRERIRAIEAVVAGTSVPRADVSTIRDELDEVLRVERLEPPRRRRLLQVLHSTRALDTFLRAFTRHYGCRDCREKARRTPPHAIGEYLVALEHHQHGRLGKLRNNRRDYYDKRIVKVRNNYMHNAGAYPADSRQIGELLSDMQACILEVANLVDQ